MKRYSNSSRHNAYVLKWSASQWRIQDFSGAPTPKGAPTYLMTNFSRKLHENEEILAQKRGEGRKSLVPPPRSTKSSATSALLLTALSQLVDQVDRLDVKHESNLRETRAQTPRNDVHWSFNQWKSIKCIHITNHITTSFTSSHGKCQRVTFFR